MNKRDPWMKYALMVLLAGAAVVSIGCGPSNLSIRETSPTGGVYGLILVEQGVNVAVNNVSGTVTALDYANRPYIAYIYDSRDASAPTSSAAYAILAASPVARNAANWAWYEFANPALPAGVLYTFNPQINVTYSSTNGDEPEISIKNPLEKELLVDTAMTDLLGQLPAMTVSVK